MTGFVLSVQAQANTLSVASGSVAQGGAVALPIALENASAVSGGQFTVTLPQGVSIKEVAMNEGRSNGHTIEYQWNESKRSALILVYAQPTAALKGNDGVLCTLTLSAAADAVAGSFPVTLGDVRLAADATTQMEAVTVDGTLTISSRYEITVDATEGGAATGGGVFDAGATVTLTATPVEGYHFVRWSDGSTANPYTFKAKANASLTAEFAPNVYRIVYMVDGVEYRVENVSYGSKVTAIAAPTKEGHTFSGWSGVPATMPAKDVTVNGSFTVNSYTMTYMVDGKVYKTESLVYGSKVTAVAAPTKEGHTFSGWSEIPTTMPARDVTVTGAFTVNSYTVTYMVDGEVYKTESLAYGSAVTVIAVPTKEGHTFSGWSGVPATMPAKDVTVSGSFTVNSYTITYMVDGKVYKTESLAYGSKVTAFAAPTKEGHTFSGWSEIPTTMPAGNVTVTGAFTVNSYTVTFILEGEVLAEYTLQYGSAIEVPEVPQKEGLTFGGWGKVPDTMPAQDLVFEGSYMNNPYTIIYIVDGVEYHRALVEYGSAITLIASPTKEGHTFSGWSEAPETMPAGDITVTGSFTVNNYTITYMVDGEVYKTESLAYGSAVTAIAVPAKEGHTFSGWSEIPATMPARDVTVSGSFTVNSYTVTYMVDGEVYKTESYAYGASVTAVESPVKEGHTFSGWSEIPTTMPAENITVTGSFMVNSYTITYMVDGEVYKTESLAYGSAVTAIAVPTKEGHTFSGWSGVPATMPAEDVTISGTFTVNTYTITYMVDGEVYQTVIVTYGATITLIDAPAKDGYTFSGWLDAPRTMPAHDVTINGHFVTDAYTVTYMVDGEVYKTFQVAYGTEIPTVEVPSKEGYTFSGWSEIPTTMPAEDVIISGVFTINKYLVTFKIDGIVLAADSLEYGSVIIAPTVPEREGYTFSGWGEVAGTVPAHDVVYEGTYTANTYRVYYFVGAMLVHTEEVAYGEAIPEYVYEPTEEGYTFLGWIGETYETMPAHDVTYTANIDDAIEQLTIDKSQLTIYDLKGRKVTDTESLKGGIYIVNGRKIVVK